MRRFEAITVCVNYSDFLAETLPNNIRHFDHFVVVTSYADTRTQDLCNHLGVECRTTDVMYKDGGAFAKGRAIDFGLAYLRKTDWVAHLDADIWLPPRTRYWLDNASLDEECIYGIDRATARGMTHGASSATSRSGTRRQSSTSVTGWLCRRRSRWCARFVLKDYEGYVPIGFFQLWHAKHDRRYPLDHSTAERTDVLHPLQWPLGKRRLLPEIIAIHLESEAGKMGTNWHGRKTPQFGRYNPFGQRKATEVGDRDYRNSTGREYGKCPSLTFDRGAGSLDVGRKTRDRKKRKDAETR